MEEIYKERLWTIVEKIPFQSKHLVQLKKNTILNLNTIFENKFERYFLELGSGWGEVAIELAEKNPETAFLLFEKNNGRLEYTSKQITKLGLENIKLACCNFNWFLKEFFLPNSFDEILLNFPDPWPKKKHWQNRTINPKFLSELEYLLKENGRFRFATDHGAYGRKAILNFRKHSALKFKEEYSFQRENFPISVFEKEKLEENKKIYYLERIK